MVGDGLGLFEGAHWREGEEEGSSTQEEEVDDQGAACWRDWEVGCEFDPQGEEGWVMPKSGDADTASLISAINERLLGSSLPKRRDVGRLPKFTSPNVKSFMASNKNSVRSAKRLGRYGMSRLADRFIRENLPTKKKVSKKGGR